MFIQNRSRVLALLVVLFGLFLMGFLFVANAVKPGGRALIKISGVDAVSYYAVSRSLLYDRDLDLSNEYARLKPVETPWIQSNSITGKMGSPWPIGFSLLQVPFLAFGGLISFGLTGTADGYSQASMALYYVGLIVYLCLGLYITGKLLFLVTDKWACSTRKKIFLPLFVTFSLWPSTTLAYYTFSAYAQTCSFMVSTGFLYAWWIAKDSTNKKSWLICASLGGLVMLCRWEKSLFLAIPFLYDFFKGRWRALIQDPDFRGSYLQSRLLLIGVSFVLFIPQMVQWKVLYGSFLTIPHGPGFFSFPPRFILHVLFSTRHGWFLWTPIAFLGTIGLMVWAKRDQPHALPLIITIGLQVAIQGSLSQAWSGCLSFGIRTLNACTPFLALGVLYLVLSNNTLVRASAAVFTLFSVWFTLTFAAQYRLDLVPDDDTLTFQELVIDKIFFLQAFKNKQRYLPPQQNQYEPVCPFVIPAQAEIQKIWTPD